MKENLNIVNSLYLWILYLQTQPAMDPKYSTWLNQQMGNVWKWRAYCRLTTALEEEKCCVKEYEQHVQGHSFTASHANHPFYSTW